jgi:PEP-CTERM motif-containing protein
MSRIDLPIRLSENFTLGPPSLRSLILRSLFFKGLEGLARCLLTLFDEREPHTMARTRNGATRKDLLILALGLALGVGTITPAFATAIKCGTACTASITLGGITIFAPVVVGPNGVGTVTNFVDTLPNGVIARINSATLNPDPSVTVFGFFTNPTTSALTVGFTFATPILLNGTINATSSIGYTLTEVGTSGVTLTAAPPPLGFVAGPGSHVLVADDFLPATNKGVDTGSSVIGGVAPCTAFAAGTSTCGPFSAANTFSGGPFTTMGVAVDFTLSAGGTASFTGIVTQNQAPEPATLLLLGSGLLGFAGWRRYSSRA